MDRFRFVAEYISIGVRPSGLSMERTGKGTSESDVEQMDLYCLLYVIYRNIYKSMKLTASPTSSLLHEKRPAFKD